MERGKKFARCLVVDDDPDILLSARLLLRDLFKEVATFQGPEEALAAMKQDAPDVILLDANFGRGATNAAEGFHWLGEILARDPQAVVVMITAHGGINIAVEAMKRGATDFVSKPWSNERLLATVRTAASLRTSRQAAVTERKRAVAISAPAAGGETPLLGASAAMRPSMRSSMTVRKLRRKPWIGQTAPSPKAQMVWPSICLVTSKSVSISCFSALPLAMRSSMRQIHGTPSRHGVH